MEIVVETDQQALRQVDILCGNNEAQRKSTQYENQHGNRRSDKNGFRIILARVLHIHHMNTHHLHTGVKEENPGRQYQVVEFRQVRKESLAHIHIVMAAGRQIDNTEHDQ